MITLQQCIHDKLKYLDDIWVSFSGSTYQISRIGFKHKTVFIGCFPYINYSDEDDADVFTN